MKYIQEWQKRTCVECRKKYSIKDIATVLWTGDLNNEYKRWCICKRCREYILENRLKNLRTGLISNQEGRK